MSGAGKTYDRRFLTRVAIEALKPEAAPYRVPDTRAAGLALRVAPSSLKTWDLAYRVQRLAQGQTPVLGPLWRSWR
jgi:hypothetical protein